MSKNKNKSKRKQGPPTLKEAMAELRAYTARRAREHVAQIVQMRRLLSLVSVLPASEAREAVCAEFTRRLNELRGPGAGRDALLLSALMELTGVGSLAQELTGVGSSEQEQEPEPEQEPAEPEQEPESQKGVLMMNDVKEWYQSRTVWASLVTVAVGLMATAGWVDLTGEQETIVDLIMQAVLLISGFTALWGRVTAKAKIRPLDDGGRGTRSMGMLLLAWVVLLAGCSQVQMSPPYQAMLEQSAIQAAELNDRCQRGDETACRDGLAAVAETLQLLVDGLQGQSSGGAEQ